MSGRRSLEYVKDRYGVPVKRGMRVTHDGESGVVTCGDGAHVRVRFDGRSFSVPCHPLSLDYGDGIDVEARLAWHNRRIEIWNDWLNHRITADEYRALMSQPLSEHLGASAASAEDARSNPKNTRPVGVLWGGGRR